MSDNKKKIIVYCVLVLVLCSGLLLSISLIDNKETEETVSLSTSDKGSLSVEEMKELQRKNDIKGDNNTGIFSVNTDEEDNTVYEDENEDVKALQKTIRDIQTQNTTTTNNNKEVKALPLPNKIEKEQEIEVKIKEDTIVTSREEVKKVNKFFKVKKKNEIGNVVAGVVQGTQIVSNDNTLKLKLKDDYITKEGIKISKGTPIYGIVKIDKARLYVNITSIRVGKNLYPVNLSVYDLDGMQGINLPTSIQAEIAKNSKATALEDDTEELIKENGSVGRIANSVSRVAKNVLAKSVREIKVEVKSNYEIFLK